MKIVIDPGHGGFDPGACANGLKEAELNRQIAAVVTRELQAAGHIVVLTRRLDQDSAPNGTSNKQSELAARTAIANASGADYFLSIHINAGGGHGAEIYVYNNSGAIAPMAARIVDNVGSLMGFHGEKVKESKTLYVLKNTHMAAALVEIGFIDTSDAFKIRDNIDRIGRLVAAGIMGKVPNVAGTPSAAPAPKPTPKPAAAPAPDDWKKTIHADAHAAGLISSDWTAKLDEPAPVWFVMAVVLNAMSHIKKGS